MSDSRSRVAGYDMLRAVAAVAVVGIHVLAAGTGARGDLGSELPWVYAAYTFIWFATPAFAFLTGALVWNYRPIRTRQELWAFLRKRASVVLYPYLAWSAFYIWFGHYTPSDMRPQLPLGEYAVDVVRLLVVGRAAFHLYFLPVVLIFYLASPVLSRLFSRWPWPTFGVLFAIGAFATIVVPEPPSDRLVTVYRLFHSTMWLLPPAAVGGLYGALRERRAAVLARIWPALLGVGLLMRWLDRGPIYVENVWMQRVHEYAYLGLTLVGLVCMLDALARRAPSVARAGRVLGAGALGVYLMHPLVIWVAGEAVVRGAAGGVWTQWWFTALLTTAVVTLCYAVVLAAGRVRWLAWAFGMPGGLSARAGLDVSPGQRPAAPA